MAKLGARKFGGNRGAVASMNVREMIGDERRKQNEDRNLKTRSMRDYAQMIPESHGPLDISKFPFQAEPLYSDEIADAEEIVYMKSTQVGATTAMFRWAVRLADQFGATVIYFFPTKIHVNDFNDERIDPSIDRSEFLQRRMGRVAKKDLKHIGAGILQLRGLESKASAQAVAARAIIFDEYDDANHDNIKHAEHRIDNAFSLGETPQIRRLGRPSVPGYGIDAKWQESDQRKWMVTCPECQLEQSVEWNENVRWKSGKGGDEILRPGHDQFDQLGDVFEAWRACKSCEASLEGDPILKGEWKATAFGHGLIPGYHLQRLIVPRTDLTKLVEESRSTKVSDIEIFHWASLGVAWSSADSRLSDDDLKHAIALGLPEMLTSAYRGRNPVTAGIDVASARPSSMRISEILPDGTRRGLWLGEPKDFAEVQMLIEKYRVTVAAIDAAPERTLAYGLANVFPGRVFPVKYDDSDMADAWRYDEPKNMIHINRVEAIDAMMSEIRGLRNLPPGRPPTNYFAQMKALVRKYEINKKGKVKRVYITSGTQGDDFAHAEVYDLVAAEMLAQMNLVQQEMDEREPEELTDVPPLPNMGYGNTDYDPGFN